MEPVFTVATPIAPYEITFVPVTPEVPATKPDVLYVRNSAGLNACNAVGLDA